MDGKSNNQIKDRRCDHSQGSDTEVSNILSVFERAAVVGHAREVATKSKTRKNETKKQRAASDLVVNLKEDESSRNPRA